MDMGAVNVSVVPPPEVVGIAARQVSLVEVVTSSKTTA